MSRIIEQPNYTKAIRSLDDYKVSVQNMLERREEWKAEIRDRIKQVLISLRERTDIQLNVDVNEDLDNLNAVILGLPNKPSGIAELGYDPFKGEFPVKQFTKTEGYLSFNQVYNGQIVVVINYPYIEDKVSQRGAAVNGYYEPKDLTTNTIIGIVADFFDAMTKWENETRQPIGFVQ